MKKIVLGLIMVSTLPAFGAEICQNLTNCRKLEVKLHEDLKQVEAKIKELNGIRTIDLSDLAVYQNGKAVTFATLEEATAYCQSQGQRVSSDDELIAMMKEWGLKTQETKYPNVDANNQAVVNEVNSMKKMGFSPIYSNNGANTISYYTLRYDNMGGQYDSRGYWSSNRRPGYNPPGSDINDIWSSSSRTIDIYWGILSKPRGVNYSNSTYPNGVICVDN